ncbi:MAG: DNA polymerase III subunit beta [Puniceicoccales bacterium]|jgi:DNA polymerase-3 subunit beta|nr:DNA polymerase III subunit beta [Puniceicoccales bacterium]
MRVKISQQAFVNGLQQVLSVVGNRSSLPILGNVLMVARPDGVEFTTTNLDMGIRCRVRAEVTEEGRIALPVKKLASIVKSLPHPEVYFECSGPQAKLSSGRSNFRIMGMQDDDFPPLPIFDRGEGCVVEQKLLAKVLRQVSYARSTDENRYLLNGVLFALKPGESEGTILTLVATDGRRLSLCEEKVEGNVSATGAEFILPAKTVGELSRLLQGTAAVNMYFNDKQVAFELALEESAVEAGLVDSIYLVSKKVEGRFPSYGSVIPKETEQRIRLERELFLECIQRVSLVASDENNVVKLKIDNNQLEILASSAEYGEAHETMAIDYNGPAVQVAFNPQFLMDPLRALTPDEVFFEFKDELSPGVFRTLEKFICVVMPLRLS